jgi:hypothetical protein
MLAPTTKLADKAMLVKLTTRRAALVKRDNALTSQLQAQEGDNSLTVLTRLFRDKNNEVNRIMAKYNEVYTYHKANTLPYIDAGPRILPSANYFEYTQEMKHRIAVADKMLDNAMPYYDDLVTQDVMFRNTGHAAGRANADEYPTADQFRNAMALDLRFQPMPDSRHFLFDLSDEDLAECARAEEEALAAANADVLARMLKPLGDLTRRLGEYQGQKGERFHNSVVENVIEGCKTARKLAINPTPDFLTEVSTLEGMAAQYLQHVEIIKGSPAARDEAKRRLSEVAERMGAYGFAA